MFAGNVTPVEAGGLACGVVTRECRAGRRITYRERLSTSSGMLINKMGQLERQTTTVHSCLLRSHSYFVQVPTRPVTVVAVLIYCPNFLAFVGVPCMWNKLHLCADPRPLAHLCSHLRVGAPSRSRIDIPMDGGRILERVQLVFQLIFISIALSVLTLSDCCTLNLLHIRF